MRLWSIHPKYLDQKGLVALWRETLLAQNVLLGKTKGYKNHPQLTRFKNHPDPISAIGSYLYQIFLEAKNRNYNFDQNKIVKMNQNIDKINVTTDQLKYEFEHLKNKLIVRDEKKLEEIKNDKNIQVHSIFNPIEGKIENWEVVK